MYRHEPASRVPFHAVVASLKTRPGMIEHLEGIDLDGDGLADIPLGPPPAEPASRIHWQDAHARRQQTQGRRVQRKDANNRIILSHLQANDPLFGTVHGKVLDFVRLLPAKLQRPILRAVEETPGAYLDLYEEMRGMLLHQGAATGTRWEAPATSQDPREAISRAVAGRMDPLTLERAARSAERDALKARCQAGKAQEGDLLRYIELSMLAEPAD